MSERYAKLSSNIVFSSLWDEDGDTCKIWVTLLALKDEKGDILGINITGIARVARQTLEKVIESMGKFMSPDPRSSTPTDDGRRLKEIPGGWHVINHEKYQQYGWSPEKKEYERDRKARWRAGKKALADQSVDSSTTPPVKKPRGFEFDDNPTLEDCMRWLAGARKNGVASGSPCTYTESEVKSAWLAQNAGGWERFGKKTPDWRSALERQIQTDRQRSNNGNNSKAGGTRVDAGKNTLNDGVGEQYAGMGRRDIKEKVPDVQGSGTPPNAGGGQKLSW